MCVSVITLPNCWLNFDAKGKHCTYTLIIVHCTNKLISIQIRCDSNDLQFEARQQTPNFPVVSRKLRMCRRFAVYYWILLPNCLLLCRQFHNDQRKYRTTSRLWSARCHQLKFKSKKARTRLKKTKPHMHNAHDITASISKEFCNELRIEILGTIGIACAQWFKRIFIIVCKSPGPLWLNIIVIHKKCQIQSQTSRFVYLSDTKSEDALLSSG